MKTHRDRGRRKKHHGPKADGVSQDDLYASFAAWLAKTYPMESEGKGPATSISVNRFLQQSAHFEFSSVERLRELAIHWEDDCAFMDQPIGWHILRQIYDEAIRLDPTWSLLYHSKSLAARRCAALSRLVETKDTIFSEAERACREGLAVDPNEGLLHQSLGRMTYGRNGSEEEALASFEAAIACGSEQLWWPQLYRAHCLHDLERWSEAAEAYRQVDRSRFVGAHGLAG